MPLNFGDLFRKTVKLIKQDYYILFPSIILYFILSIVDVISPLTIDLKAKEIGRNLQIFLITLSFVHIYIQTLVIAMSKSILESSRINFWKSLLISVRKFLLVLILSLLLLIPPGLVLVITAQIAVLRIGVTVVAVWAIIILLPMIAVVMVNDDLGIWNTIRKLFIFIRRNPREFFTYSTYYISMVIGLMLISGIFYDIPAIGKNFLFPVLQGIQGTFFTIMTYIFYVKYNEKKC